MVPSIIPYAVSPSCLLSVYAETVPLTGTFSSRMSSILFTRCMCPLLSNSSGLLSRRLALMILNPNCLVAVTWCVVKSTKARFLSPITSSCRPSCMYSIMKGLVRFSSRIISVFSGVIISRWPVWLSAQPFPSFVAMTSLKQ